MIADPFQRSDGIGRRNDPGCWMDATPGVACKRPVLAGRSLCRRHWDLVRRWTR
jgi:hypothetical protein